MQIKYKPLKIGHLEAKIPIIQGGMGVGISLSGLAGAVAKEGGVGIISSAQIGFNEPDFEQNPKECNLRAMETEYKKARAIAPNGVIGFNIMVALRHYEEYVVAACKAGADLIISGAGLPTDLPKYVEGFKTKIAPIVSTVKSAAVILKYWDRKYNRTADMVVIEGPKAGGHLGFTKEQLDHYLPGGRDAVAEVLETGESTADGLTMYEQEIVDIVRTVREYEEKYQCHIPVVVAGGIDDSQAMERAMKLPIDGVQIASRFVTTQECDASLEYKMAYVNAQKEDIMIVKSPVGMPGRAIRNPFMDRVMSGEKITPKKCLGCLHKCNPVEIPYCITEALVNAARGKLDQALIFCGANSYRADKIETVHDVMVSFAY